MDASIERLRDIVLQWEAGRSRRWFQDVLFFILCGSAPFLIGGQLWVWIAAGRGLLAVLAEYAVYRSKLLLSAYDNPD